MNLTEQQADALIRLNDDARAWAERERKLAEQRKEAADERNRHIRAMSLHGASLRNIAEVTGLSHTAIAKILS